MRSSHESCSLLQKIRSGLPITLIDKIDSLASSSELAGFSGQLTRDKHLLSAAEQGALARKQVALLMEENP